MMNLTNTQRFQLALQAASRPIDEKAPEKKGLTDWLTRSQTRQIWLSGAINGMSRCLALLQCAAIHNYQLSMLFPPFQQNTMKNRKRRQHFFCFSSPFSQGHIGWPFVKGKRSGLDKRASDMAPAPLLPATWGWWWPLCRSRVRAWGVKVSGAEQVTRTALVAWMLGCLPNTRK